LVFENIGIPPYTSGDHETFTIYNGVVDTIIRNNTMASHGTIENYFQTGSGSAEAVNLEFRGNLLVFGTYGMFSTGATGEAIFTTSGKVTGNSSYAENVVIGPSKPGYPTTTFVPDINAGRATGRGANEAQVAQMTAGVISGVWGACTDTTWTPDPATKCGTFTQTSNCANTRTATGTLVCSGSTPVCGTINTCVQCAQNSHCGSGQYCQNNVCITPPAAALLAAYNFSEGSGSTTADYSGNGRTGTLTGTSWVAGKYGNGLSFDPAQNSAVTIADFPPPQSITIEAWIYPTGGAGTDRMVLSKGISEYEFRIVGSLGVLQAGLGSPRFRDTVDFNNPTNLNKWYHYAYTYDVATSEAKLYRDGVLINSTTGASTVTDTTNSLMIGRSPELGSSFMGVIDEVRVWNAARTQAQIIADMNGGGGGCTDTTWTPDATNLCGNVNQTSNCGNTRTITGGVICLPTETCSNNACVPQPSRPEDRNGDGSIDVQDVLIIVQNIQTNNLAGDINSDGLVNILDVIRVVQAIGT
jgi:Cys-rich repeat protein